MLKTYEAMFLVDPSVSPKDANKIPDDVNNILERYNVKIIQKTKWADRTMAYKIKGHRRGSYYLVYFDSAPDNISKIKRDCYLSPNIIRVLILSLEPSVKSKILGSINQPVAVVTETK